MEPNTDSARWASIATALGSPVVKSQAAVWELERRQMLDIVRQFWTAEERNFRNFVENSANDEALPAIVVTSLEDMPAVRFFSPHDTVITNSPLSAIQCIFTNLWEIGICWRTHGCMLPGTTGR